VKNPHWNHGRHQGSPISDDMHSMDHANTLCPPAILLVNAGEELDGLRSQLSKTAGSALSIEVQEVTTHEQAIEAVIQRSGSNTAFRAVCMNLNSESDNILRRLHESDPRLQFLLIADNNEVDLAHIRSSISVCQWRLTVGTVDPLSTHHWLLSLPDLNLAPRADDQDQGANLDSTLETVDLNDAVNGVRTGIATPVDSIDGGIRTLGDAFYNMLSLIDAFDELEREVRHVPGLKSRLAVIEEARRDADVETLMEEVPTALLMVSNGLETLSAITHSLEVIGNSNSSNREAA